LPPSHNGLKFAVIGGVLVTAALLLLFCSPGEEPPAALPMLDAGVTPTTSQFQNEFELPVEEPDAGPAVVAVAEDTSMRPATMRAVRDCEGTIAPAALQAAVTRYRGQVRQCYERALKQNNMLQGRVTVTVASAPTGAWRRPAPAARSVAPSTAASPRRRAPGSWWRPRGAPAPPRACPST
jgi:hypothetical protein